MRHPGLAPRWSSNSLTDNHPPGNFGQWAFSCFSLLIERSFAKIPPHKMGRVRSTKSPNNSSANIGFEQKLWLAADKVRSNMDAAWPASSLSVFRFG